MPHQPKIGGSGGQRPPAKKNDATITYRNGANETVRSGHCDLGRIESSQRANKQPKVKHENPASLAIVTGFGYRQRWGAWQVRKEFHTIFLVNPNIPAVHAIHVRKKAVMRCAEKILQFRTKARG